MPEWRRGYKRGRAASLTEGLRPSDSPTRALARRCAGSLRSRGSLATLARDTAYFTVCPDSSVSPITRDKRLNSGGEIGLVEVRPHDLCEVELRVGRLPQQEVTQPLFAAGADEQIYVTRTSRCVDGLTQALLESLTGKGQLPGGTAGRRQQRIAGRIVDRNPKVERRPFARTLLDLRDAVSEGSRNPVPTPYYVEANTTVRHMGTFGVHVLLQQKHQVIDLRPADVASCPRRKRRASAW